MISILILTKNEERDLPGCLDSVKWSDDIHVFDSYSTDQTVQLARAAGARVTQRKFDDWSQHQNWGLHNLQFKYPWVFYLDADERTTPVLQENLQRAVAQPSINVAFRVQRRDFFLDRWLKHSQATSLYTRLFRPEKMRYERLVNPVSIVDGPVGQVSGYLDHFPFSKGISHWLDRHNSYSSLEAQQIADNNLTRGGLSLTKLYSNDFAERRHQQKELFYRVPARPLVKFLLLYVAKRGFLDGRPGFTYAVLQSFYEYMIVLKARELSGRTGKSSKANHELNELSGVTADRFE